MDGIATQMTSTTTSTAEFDDAATAMETAKESAPKYEVALGAIDKSKPKPILLNIESGVKNIISAIAGNKKIDGVDISAEEFAKLPNSQTGVAMYFIVKGLKEEFGIGFDNQPTSLKIKGLSNKFDKKVESKKRLLTRDQKNEILARMDMKYYMNDILIGKLTTEDAVEGIKEAFNTKKQFEDMGYMLPDKKTDYPYWKDEAGAEEATA